MLAKDLLQTFCPWISFVGAPRIYINTHTETEEEQKKKFRKVITLENAGRTTSDEMLHTECCKQTANCICTQETMLAPHSF